MRAAVLVGLLSLGYGCALVAGLDDREPPDPAASSDATAPGDAQEAGAAETGADDGAATVAAAAADAPLESSADSAVDAGLDASADAEAYKGVVCGTAVCAVLGCCVEDASCQTFLACATNHASCDGPEDCTTGKKCCSAGANGSGLCNAGNCVTYRCHTNADCNVAAGEPNCCPEPAAPNYGKCQAGPCT